MQSDKQTRRPRSGSPRGEFEVSKAVAIELLANEQRARHKKTSDLRALRLADMEKKATAKKAD